VITSALRIIAENDSAAYIDINKYIKALVEVSENVRNLDLGSSGMAIGVYYGDPVEGVDLDVAEKALACTIVQFATCCKLLNNVNSRCPYRRDTSLLKKIKRISFERMLRFTINAGFDGRYSYEIECKLKNGTYEC
jgi:hypothetical protein